MTFQAPISLAEVRSAKERISAIAIRTPLIRLNAPDVYPAGQSIEIYLKLETLQPTGSFKLRGAGNAMLSVDPKEIKDGVWTVSAGNMGLGVAHYALALGVSCSVVVPENAPTTKLEALQRLGAQMIKVAYPKFFEILNTHHFDGMPGLFIHPFGDPAVMAGNGTIALEILEDLPDPDTVIIPYGGGGLSCGMASCLRALNPAVRILAAEAEIGAPLSPSLATGQRVQVEYRPSFISGIGSPAVFSEMWPLARQLLDGSLVVNLPQIADAIRLLAERHHIIVEGAGAVALAAALSGKAGGGKVVCVISGGNLDHEKLATILKGETPD